MSRAASLDDRNQRYWSSTKVVAEYLTQAGLTTVERLFCQRVPDLPTAAVLDVGVGAGRPADALLDVAGRYVGVDWSAPLIAACRRRFEGRAAADAFLVADARDLSVLPTAAFDVVLFGSNGLDYVDHAGRQRVLAELARVARPGARCGLSSHHLGYLTLVLTLRERVDRLRRDRSGVRLPLALARHLPRRALSILRNPSPRVLSRQPWATVADDGRLFAPTRTYYVAPAEMERQLAAVGFAVDAVWTPDGAELPPPRGDRQVPWLFWSLTRLGPDPTG